MHVPEGEKIPAKKLEQAAHSSKPSLKRKAVLAKTLKGTRHKSDGGGIDDSIDVRDDEYKRHSVGPVNLRQMMDNERTKMDIDEINKGTRFNTYGSRIPGTGAAIRQKGR